MITALLFLLVSFATALAAVPIAKRIATAWGIVDKPDAKRKLHVRVVPLSGGLTIAITSIVCLGLGLSFSPEFRTEILGHLPQVLGLILAVTILLSIGLLDDGWGIRGRQKLLGQGLAVVTFITVAGYNQPINIFEGQLPWLFSFVVLTIWLVGSINAVNLIDGADGLASTVGIVGSMAIFFMTFDGTLRWESMFALILCGTLAGFLVFNFPPASTFLGDSGSMLIGLLLGALATQASVKEGMSIALCAPVAIVAIPLFDSFAAIVRRRLTGRSIYMTDRGHLHHTLLERGFGPYGLILFVAALCAVSAIGGIASVRFHNHWWSVLSVAAVLLLLVAGRIFGFAEFKLLVHRIRALAHSFWVVPRAKEVPVLEQITRLQGSRDWEKLWESITEFADRHGLSEVCLDLNLPWLHEGFHAVWRLDTKADAHECWHTRIPLAAYGKTLGRLEITAPLSKTSVYLLLSMLSDLLESMEPILARLAHDERNVEMDPAKLNRPSVRVGESLEGVTGSVGSDRADAGLIDGRKALTGSGILG